MNTDLSDLSLMQISDSFFPTGLYTMSNGLETLFSEKRITGMDELWIPFFLLGFIQCLMVWKHYFLKKG